MTFAFEEPSFELAPGADRRVGLVVKPRAKKNFGPTVNRPFKIEARQGGSQSPSSTSGQLIVKPPLEPYKIPALAVIALLVLGGIAFAAIQLLGGGSEKKAAPDVSPTAQASTAPTVAATATPAGLHVGGNGVIVNSDPTPSNTNCLAVRTSAVRAADNISGRLCTGEKVAIKGGPTTADGFTWWQVQSASGLSGWAAEKSADGATPFIQPTP